MDETLRPLSYAFWLEVAEDLLRGDLLTYLWLWTGNEPCDFLWWCEITDKEATGWKGMLLRLWDLRGTEAVQRALKLLKKGMESAYSEVV